MTTRKLLALLLTLALATSIRAQINIGLLTRYNETLSVARIAVEDINAGKFPGLLPNITLNMLTAWDLGRATVVVQALPLSGYCEQQRTVVGIVGGEFSSTSVQLQSLLVPMEIPQISPSATSPELSDKTVYPYFFRTAPPDGQQAAAIAAIMAAYGWTQCSIVASLDSYGRAGLTAFLNEAARENITVVQSLTVQASQSDYGVEIAALKRARTPINVWMGSEVEPTDKFVIQAGREGLFGGRYAWIFSDSYVSSTFASRQGPDNNETHIYLKGALGVVASAGTGQIYDNLVQSWIGKGLNVANIGVYTVLAYDAVLALAYGINRTISAGQNPANGSMLRQQLLGVNFTGASGSVTFDKVGDRIGLFSLVGVAYDGDTLGWKKLATVVGSTNVTATVPRNFIWADGTTDVPADSFVPKKKIPKWGIAVMVLSGLFFIATVAIALVFSIRHKFHMVFIPRTANPEVDWS